MEFELNEEQKNIKEAAREFAEKEFKPELGREYDEKSEFPWELYKKAAKLGFIGISLPEEYGGQGLGTFEECLVREEFHRVDSTLGVIMAGCYGADLIDVYGTEEQKEKYLPRICRGEILSAMALTEPAYGTDAGTVGLSTTAVKEGDEYVINGTKTFISNGDIAEFVIVCCQTDPKADPPYRGISQIIVEKGTPGFEARKLEPKMGYNALHHAELSFDNVRVPVENLLGQENRGFYQVMSHLNKARIDVAAWAVGVAQGVFERALRYSKERVQFRQPIARFQMIQSKIAEMAMRIEAARLLTYKAAWLLDKGVDREEITKQAAMAKAFAAKVAIMAADEAIQIHGGYGYVDSHIERYYRDCRVYNIIEGTEEIMRYIIASRCYSKVGFKL
ncbi:MAG: acyl-CoA dehydrogenase family protein [Candidatus Baldrarchaeia archaeon]